MDVALAESDQDIEACFPVMAELHPHFKKEAITGSWAAAF